MFLSIEPNVCIIYIKMCSLIFQVVKELGGHGGEKAKVSQVMSSE